MLDGISHTNKQTIKVDIIIVFSLFSLLVIMGFHRNKKINNRYVLIQHVRQR